MAQAHVRVDKPLSAGERLVVDLIADGLGNRQIAEKLGKSHGTVKNQMNLIFAKLGVSNRYEVIVMKLKGKL